MSLNDSMLIKTPKHITFVLTFPSICNLAKTVCPYASRRKEVRKGPTDVKYD